MTISPPMSILLRYLEIIADLSSNFPSSTTHLNEMGVGEQDEVMDVDPVSLSRRLLAMPGLLRSLPANNRCRLMVERRLKLRWEENDKDASARAVSSKEEDLWGTTESPQFSRRRAAAVSVSAGDEDLWGSPTSRRGARGKGRYDQDVLQDVTTPRGQVSIVRESFLDLLLEVLCNGADALTSVQRDAVSKEVEHVFSTWRKAHLLLDYYTMHAGSPPLQRLHKRFLCALFGISDETVDDIRYNDPGNRRQLDRMPQEVVRAWREGWVFKDDGERVFLPGYTDAQTLFMLGEDMSEEKDGEKYNWMSGGPYSSLVIRATERVGNKGLLSIVLHGNCRVLGRKRDHGGLICAAVARLVVDEASSRVVLHVGAVQGDSNGPAVEQVCVCIALTNDTHFPDENHVVMHRLAF